MLSIKKLKRIVNDGGATLRRDGVAVKYNSGYQVSKQDCYIIDITETEELANAVNTVLAMLNRGEFCGIWINDGQAYIDISIRLADKGAALNMGRKLNQISIYEWATGNCINC